jgi:hypothetical protein
MEENTLTQINWSSTYLETCELFSFVNRLSFVNHPNKAPMAIVDPIPANTMKREKKKLFLFNNTVETIKPWMGVMSGATIIAPITVAVLSPTTPAVAITHAEMSNSQNLDRRVCHIHSPHATHTPFKEHHINNRMKCSKKGNFTNKMQQGDVTGVVRR